MAFSLDEVALCRRLIAMALEEDLAGAGDITSQAMIPPELEATTRFVARAPGTLAGLPAAALVIEALGTGLRLEPQIQDGDQVTGGTVIASLSGPARGILA